MGFRNDFMFGYQEVEEDKVYFQHVIDGNLIYLSVDDRTAEIRVKWYGRNSGFLLTAYQNKMSADEFKDKLEEYYGTRDLMILRENMEDFIGKIRSEEK